MIKLHTPRHLTDKTTISEIDPNEIISVSPVNGENDPYSFIRLRGSLKDKMCLESASEIKKLIAGNSTSSSLPTYYIKDVVVQNGLISFLSNKSRVSIGLTVFFVMVALAWKVIF